MKYIIALLLLLGHSVLGADFQTGQPADFLLGIPNHQVISPRDLAVDPLTEKLFVCDGDHNRILRYSSAEALKNDAVPEAVIGQPDLYDRTPRTTASGLRGPYGICVDHTGRLWVSDSGNARVLRFDNASSLPSGAAASGVLGQPNFSSSTTSVARNRVTYPVGLAVDHQSRLWVADHQANRILRWDNAANLAAGALADGVLGQPNFTTGSENPASASTMQGPMGLAVENATGSPIRLWVVDFYNWRVLGFNNPVAKPAGAPADKLLGRTSFTEDSQPLGSTRNNFPFASRVAMQGADLWVLDQVRVLRFANAGSKAHGADADSVIGQFNFTETEMGFGTWQLFLPTAIAVSGQRLWIGDLATARLVRHENASSKNGQPTPDGTLNNFFPGDGTDLEEPVSTAIDPVSGKLFVCERKNSRVLRYASAASLKQGDKPEAVFGQQDFVSVNRGTSASTLNYPSAITVDRLGSLWVVDELNNRVLRFANAATAPSGIAAVQVFGQGTFTTSGRGQMDTPGGIATESGVQPTPPYNTRITRLWVADTANNRVLSFVDPYTLANGAPASVVLGQPTASSSTPALSTTRMASPAGLAVDGLRLWVADRDNRRVLRFENAYLKATGAAADGVLLQSTFTEATNNTAPTNVAVGPNGRIFVTSTTGHRVLWFNNAAAKVNGAPADGVIGQPNLTSTDMGGSFRGLTSPTSAVIDNTGRLWVSDALALRRYTQALESSITAFGFNTQNRFTLTINGRGGETYEIRSSTDLLNWSTLERTDTVPGTTFTTMSWTAPAAPTGPRKFYRLQQQQ